MTGLNNAARDDRPFHFCSSAAPTPELYIGIAINGDYQNTDADSEMGTGTESDRSLSQSDCQSSSRSVRDWFRR